MNANASSGLPVALSVDPSSTSGCTISGSTVSYGGGVGTCVTDANQLGSDAFLAAPQVQQSFTIAQGWQSITFVSSAPLSASYSGSNNQTYVVNANASSGLPATFSIDSSSTSGCTISGLTVSYGGGVGTCVIDANQAGNAGYVTATEVQQSFTIGQASQTISFSTTAPSSVTYSESNDQIYLVGASASSDLPVALSIDPSSTSGLHHLGTDGLLRRWSRHLRHRRQPGRGCGLPGRARGQAEFHDRRAIPTSGLRRCLDQLG